MKITSRVALAVTILFLTSAVSRAQSIAQTALYISDGGGHLTAITAPTGPGTIILPSGGGTLMTNAGTGGVNLAGTFSTSGGAFTLGFTLSNNTSLTLPPGPGTLAVNPMTALGDMIYGGASGAPTQLLGNSTGSTKKFLTSTASSGVATAPAWGTIAAADMPVFVGEGSSAAQGAVPSPGNSGTTTRYLREDGNWVAPSGSSAVMVSGSNTTAFSGSGIEYIYPFGMMTTMASSPSISNNNVMLVSHNGTIKNLTVTLTGVPTGINTATFTIYDATTSTASTVAVTFNSSSTVTLNDNTDTYNVLAGHLISIQTSTTHSGFPGGTVAAWAFDIQ